MKLGDTIIEDTFAEAFRMVYARLCITAHDEHWLDAALHELTGYSSSVIACDSETGIEQMLDVDATPDGRIGASVLVFVLLFPLVLRLFIVLVFIFNVIFILVVIFIFVIMILGIFSHILGRVDDSLICQPDRPEQFRHGPRFELNQGQQ